MRRVLLGTILGIILGIILLLIMFIIVYFHNARIQNEYKNYQIVDYELQGGKYRFLVADSPKKWEKGLMYYRKLDGVEGMIFKFPDEDYRNFWNKNTLMDLKLYWIDKGKVMGTTQLPSIEKSKDTVTVSSPSKADTVIEIPAK